MGDGFVRFGAVVNVIATGLPVDGSGCGTWALAVSLAEDFASSAKDITNDKCHLALAAVAFSCARNTFRIVRFGKSDIFTKLSRSSTLCSLDCSTDEHDRTNEILKYNQHFQLELVQCPADRQMVVHSSIKCGAALNVAHSPHTFYCNGEANLSIGLGVKTVGVVCSCFSYAIIHFLAVLMHLQHVPKVQTRWKCLYRAPEDRFENEGEPVKLNHDLGILHVASNRLLAAEPTWANSAFGMVLFNAIYKNCKNLMLLEWFSLRRSLEYQQRRTGMSMAMKRSRMFGGSRIWELKTKTNTN